MLKQEMPQADRDAMLQALMNKYGTALVRLCYAWLGDAALAEDAVQESFVKAWKHLDRFRGESAQKTWLTRIAINTCKDMRRTRWFRHLLDGGQDALAAVAAPQRAEADDTVSRAIASLPMKDRQVVLLHYYQGLTLEEIGKVLGLGVPAINSRLFRARSKLSDMLRGWYFDEE